MRKLCPGKKGPASGCLQVSKEKQEHLPIGTAFPPVVHPLGLTVSKDQGSEALQQPGRDTASERQLAKPPRALRFCPCIRMENGHRFLCLYLLGTPDGTRSPHLPGSVFGSEPSTFPLPPTSGFSQLFPGPRLPQMPPLMPPLQTESQVSASVTVGRPPSLPLPGLASPGLGWRREPHTG